MSNAQVSELVDDVSAAPFLPTQEPPVAGVSHNLLGQRLGRKGRETRASILQAAERLLASPEPVPFSLSAVAREASLGMTTLYLYFNDLTELLLSVLEPIMDSSEEVYIAQLRERWDEAHLAEECLRFVRAFYGFWQKHARILHLRNAMASAQDERMAYQRLNAARPIINLFMHQMDGSQELGMACPTNALATVMMTATERLVTVSTDMEMQGIVATNHPERSPVERLIVAQARMMELGILEGRRVAAERK